VGDIERQVIDRLEVGIAFGDAGQLEPRHDQTTRPIRTKRSVSSMAPPMNRIGSTETAATVGSIFHSRYCRIAIGSVVRPAPTKNRLISRLPNEVTKPNSAAATMPGRIAGSVTRRNVVHGGAPKFLAASSIVGSKPARLAVTSRAAHGITISPWAAISPAVVPSNGSPVAI